MILDNKMEFMMKMMDGLMVTYDNDKEMEIGDGFCRSWNLGYCFA